MRKRDHKNVAKRIKRSRVRRKPSEFRRTCSACGFCPTRSKLVDGLCAVCRISADARRFATRGPSVLKGN